MSELNSNAPQLMDEEEFGDLVEERMENLGDVEELAREGLEVGG